MANCNQLTPLPFKGLNIMFYCIHWKRLLEIMLHRII